MSHNFFKVQNIMYGSSELQTFIIAVTLCFRNNKECFQTCILYVIYMCVFPLNYARLNNEIRIFCYVC